MPKWSSNWTIECNAKCNGLSKINGTQRRYKQCVTERPDTKEIENIFPDHYCVGLPQEIQGESCQPNTTCYG